MKTVSQFFPTAVIWDLLCGGDFVAAAYLFNAPFSLYGVVTPDGRIKKEVELFGLVEEYALDMENSPFCRKGDARDRPLISRALYSSTGEFLGIEVSQEK